MNSLLLRWPSPAKLNLFLYINQRLDNGYHELQTLFQFIDYCDYLTFIPNTNANITLVSSINGVDHEQNLIVKAARLLQRYTQSTQGVTITIEKNIPLGGGLGGGSSNAATTLIALNHLWNCQLSLDELAKLGLTLGADVPIFIHGHAAFAEGVGEKLTFISPNTPWYLVIHPNISISTADVFNDPQLTRDTPKRPLSELLKFSYTNDCEKIVKKHFSIVEQTIAWLLQYAPSRLTGTGACVFAEFSDEQQAKNVLGQLPDKNFSAFIAKGLNQSPLHTLLSSIVQNNNS